MSINDVDELKSYLLLKAEGVDFEKLAKDLLPFVSTEKDAAKIILFPEWVKAL